MRLDNLANYSKPLLRISISFLFLWFGTTQLINPGAWISFIPKFVLSFGFHENYLVIFNGLFELIFGALLLIGLYTRLSSGLLALHLFGIALSIGYNPLGIRDFTLALATLTVVFAGSDKYTSDYKWKAKQQQ